MSFFRKLANWYFRKNALPYWSIFLLDGVILLLSGFISYPVGFHQLLDLYQLD